MGPPVIPGVPPARETVKNAHTVLRTALDYAVREGYIHMNPASVAALPRYDVMAQEAPSEVEAPHPAVITHVLQAASTHRLYALLDLYAHLGLRRGEGLGLKWSDFDPEKRALHIRREVVLIGRTPTFQPPKNVNSVRVFHLADETVDVLLAHWNAQQTERHHAGDAWQETDLIFCAEDGSVLHPDHVLRWVKRLLTDAGYPHGHVRALRYFVATGNERNGVDARITRAHMGHGNVSALDHYQRPNPDMQRQALEAIVKLTRSDEMVE